MDLTAAPSDLVAALLSAGYRVVGPVGRGAGGPAWSAVALDGPPDRVVVRPVDLGPDPRHRARLERLRAVHHDHLARIRDVIEVSPTRSAILVDHLAGPTLAALRAVRGPLSTGEAVTLVVPLADALEALHVAGLVHGDVSPANVVIQLDGRPVLVDLLGCITGSRGTSGFAAPEVARGGECGPAGDVHALAKVVLSQLGPDDAGPGPQGSAAWSDARRVRGLLAGASDPDPEARLGARDLADACFRAHEPEPIVLPDSAVLARAELSILTSRPGPSVTRRHTSRHRGRRSWIAPTAWLVGAAAAASVCVGLALAIGEEEAAVPAADASSSEAPSAGIALVDDDPAGSAGSGAGTGEAGVADPASIDLAEVARRLTDERARILVEGDPAALEDVEVPGSPAHAADAALLEGLASRGLRLEGLTAGVSAAWVVVPGADEARVAVTAAASEHRRVRADGAVDAVVPAGDARTVELVLRRVSDAWRVYEVRQPDAGSTEGVSAP